MNNLALLIPDIKIDNPKPDPDLWNTTNINWENAFRIWNEINLITDIDYQRLDLFDDEQVSLTQTIQDVRDIEKIFTDFSRSFSLPASAKNNLLFRHYYRTDIVEDLVSDAIFNANTKLRAIIELNYKRFKSGYIVLNGVKLKNNQPESYNITFFGETVTLKDKIKDRVLSSLDFSSFDHAYSVANVKQGVESFVTALGNQTVSVASIIYPLISHTQRFIFNSASSDGGVLTTQDRSSTTRNLFANGSQATSGSGATERLGSTKGFVFNDLKPAIRVIDIIRMIEQDPDIDLKFSDDFFTDTGMFGDLYMWLHRNKGQIGITPSNESNVSKIILNNISNFSGDLTTFFDPSPFGSFPQFDGGIFRFRTGDQLPAVTETMKIVWTVTPNTSSAKFTAKLRKAGTGEIISEVQYTQVGSLTLTQNFVTVNTNSFEKHNVEFVIETTETTLVLTYSLTFQRVVTTNTGTVTSNLTAGLVEPNTLVETIFVTDNIPEISILSFLTGLFKMFNLTAFIEDDPSSADFGDVVVKTLDSFYASGSSRDITDFVDTSEGESNFSVPFNDVEFKFSDPETFGAFFFEKINNRQLGSVKARDANNSGRDPRLNRGQDYRIELPFEKMFFEKLKNGADQSDTTIGFGYFVDDNQDPVVNNPLMFFRASTRGTTIQMQDGTSVGSPASLTTFNRASNFRVGTQSVEISISASESGAVSFTFVEPDTFVTTATSVSPGATSTLNPIVTGSLLRTSAVASESNVTTTFSTVTTGQTLNFGNEVDPFVPTIENNTLFESFYKKYIRDVFSYNRRLVKVNAILPQKFLLRYKLSDTIVVNNTEFYINKISTNLQTGKSTLELLTKINTIS
tara:strand:- start:1333 stop:3894 length:2562 start_codon:yes stop_codon:yes gene_type:complete